MTVSINIQDLSVSFQLYYDRNRTVKSKLAEYAKRISGQYEPKMFHALKRVSFSASSGDIVGIIGPNGAGKTTLLRAICGIYHPDGGVVDVHGRLSMLLSLGTGFDNNMSGIDNIRLNGMILGMKPDEIDEAIPRIVEYADIGEHVHMPLHYYSSGMISRLSFAIVTAMKPDILIIDEVLSVGDLAFQKKSERTMHELMQQAKCQVIVSHSLNFIKEHCNRVLYMRSGSIEDYGDPETVIERYEADCAAGRK